MTIEIEKATHPLWRMLRNICGSLILLMSSIFVWRTIIFPLSQDELLYIWLFFLIYCYLIFVSGLAMVKKGPYRDNWDQLISFRKSPDIAWRGLFSLCIWVGLAYALNYALCILGQSFVDIGNYYVHLQKQVDIFVEKHGQLIELIVTVCFLSGIQLIASSIPLSSRKKIDPNKELANAKSISDPVIENNALLSFFALDRPFKTSLLIIIAICVIVGSEKQFSAVTIIAEYLDAKFASCPPVVVTPPTAVEKTLTGKLMGGTIQGAALNLTGAVSTLAVVASTRPEASLAAFNQPRGMTSDGSNLYIADSENNRIRKVVLATGIVTTLAGSGKAGSTDGKDAEASFDTPRDIVFENGNLYVADSGNDLIRRIDLATGTVSTLAGTAQSSGSADGKGAAASFLYPRGITSDGVNLYVADSGNHKIRKIVIATEVVSTLAGGDAAGFSDGSGTAASFNGPEGISTDRSNLYVADTFNHRIRKIAITSGEVTTLAGGAKGFADGIGDKAAFKQPMGIIFSGNNLYVADNGNNTFRKLVIATGEVITPEGNKPPPQNQYQPHNAGLTPAEDTYKPNGLATDGNNLYVSDGLHHSLRMIDITNSDAYLHTPGTPVPASQLSWGMKVTTLAGATGNAGFADDAVNPDEALKSEFHHPEGVTTDGISLFVSDHHAIHEIVILTGEETVLAGTEKPGAVNGSGASASFNQPSGITTDGKHIFVADSQNHLIRKISIATKEVTTLAGSGTAGVEDGTGTEATFNHPGGITTDGNFIYVSDSANNRIRKIQIDSGTVTTLVTAGSVNAAGEVLSFSNPQGIATDGILLYVAVSGNHKICTIEIASGVVTTLAGSGIAGSQDAAGVAASFNNPVGLVSDGSNLYVTESGNHKIRRIEIATGVVTSLAGSGIQGLMDESGAKAAFSSPQGITSDGKNLFVADSDNHKIRIIK